MSLESSEWIFINWNQVSWSCWSKIKSVRWASCFTRPSRIRTGPCRVRTNFSLPVGQKRKFSRKRILQPRRKEMAHKLLSTRYPISLLFDWGSFVTYSEWPSRWLLILTFCREQNSSRGNHLWSSCFERDATRKLWIRYGLREKCSCSSISCLGKCVNLWSHEAGGQRQGQRKSWASPLAGTRHSMPTQSGIVEIYEYFYFVEFETCIYSVSF